MGFLVSLDRRAPKKPATTAWECIRSILCFLIRHNDLKNPSRLKLKALRYLFRRCLVLITWILPEVS